MILKDFIESEQNDLERFKEYWERMNNKNPEHFPMDMVQGEWFEQYIAFGSINISDDGVIYDT